MTDKQISTLNDAAVILGPIMTEHHWIKESARLQAAMQTLTGCLVELLDGHETNELEVSNAIEAVSTHMPSVMVALERIVALIGHHTDGYDTSFYSVHTMLLNALACQVDAAKIKKLYPNPRAVAEDSPLYTKKEILDLVVAMADRDRREAENGQ